MSRKFVARSAKLLTAISAILVLSIPSARGQSAQVTVGALGRTFMVQYKNERGTIFSIDVNNREYWITAKHILTGAKSAPFGEYDSPTVTVSILSPADEVQKWVPETFSVIDPGKDIDIVVLVPQHALLPTKDPLTVGSKGVAFGGDCEFLGFPYGGGWRAHWATGQSVWYPYVKHCTVSASLEDTKIWVLDGINNVGFSGGPVLSGTGTQQNVFAVVSGYHTEPADVVDENTDVPPGPGAAPNSKPDKEKTEKKEIVNVNSGFIIAYSIDAAIDAIQKNPIGPLRTSQ